MMEMEYAMSVYTYTAPPVKIGCNTETTSMARLQEISLEF